MLTMDISQRYIFTHGHRHTFYKSLLTVDMLLHVTAGKSGHFFTKLQLLGLSLNEGPFPTVCTGT